MSADSFIAKALAEWLEREQEDFEETYLQACSKTDSPAEGLLAVLLAKAGDTWGTIRIEPQAKVKGYRVDFLVTLEGDPGTAGAGRSAQVIVEVDGHDFHERTKEQASRDRERDRRLLAAGYNVMRFTGSDVYHRAYDCAMDVIDYLAERVYSKQAAPA